MKEIHCVIYLIGSAGYRMKGTSSLRCAATGCWTPNELPQCIREDLYGKSNPEEYLLKFGMLELSVENKYGVNAN